MNSARELVGRDTECRDIDELLELARQGRSRALLLRGEAGIGKTALLRYAAGRATGMTVLSARGIQSESEIPFSGLLELLRPLLGKLDALPDRQATALAGALAIGPPTGADPFAVAAATLSLVAAAAVEAPLLVIVDDLQWVDTSSSEAMLFAARRLGAEPAALLFAMRDGEGAAPASPGIPVRHVTGLDRAASHALLSAQVGEPVPEEVAERLFVQTGGNPLALIELPGLLPHGLRAGSEALGDQPLPVSAGLERAFARQVAALPDGAQAALLIAAANDAPDVDPVLGALRVLGLGTPDLEAAEVAGLVASNGLRLEFRHPLVRSAVYYGADAPRRREAHRALAAALDDDADENALRRAWHLAAATLGHDEAVASLLDAAAAAARRRGGFAAAARAWERAGRLSTSDAQARRLLAAAEAWQLANHYDHAVSLLDEASLLTRDRLLLAEIEHLRGRIDTWRGPALEACERLRAVAEDLREGFPEQAARILTDAAPAAITGGDLRRALLMAERALPLALPVGGTLELLAALQLGKVRILTGDVPNGYPHVMRAVELLDGDGPPADDGELVQCAPALLTVEEYDLTDRILAAFIAAQRAANAAGLLAYSLAAQAELEVRTGRWAAAAANGSEAVQLAREAGQDGQLSYNLARLARLEAAQGRDDSCRTDVARALSLAERHSFGSTLPFAHSALGLLELGRGRLSEAIRHLEQTASLWSAEGFREPGRLEWQGDLVEAYARSGLRDDAERVLEELEDQAGACRRPGRDGRPDTACTLAHAVAARCRGLLASEGDAPALFESALAWHAWTATPFEHGRTRLCLGEQLRRAGRRLDARVHLAAALETFDRLDADPWGDRARAELAATGERVEARRARPMEDLTAQELQVALLVAAGATNKEAGAALFLTPKTIEFHLAKIYRKLDLRSRTELAVWAARQAPGSSA